MGCVLGHVLLSYHASGRYVATPAAGTTDD
jgi:hypothetical protein